MAAPKFLALVAEVRILTPQQGKKKKKVIVWKKSEIFQLCQLDTAGNTLEVYGMITLLNAIGLTPFSDGNAWCYLLGDNLQVGIVGFGNTIEEAAIDFLKDVKRYYEEAGN